MAQFQYIARDKQGKTIKATLEAESKEAAADLVKRRVQSVGCCGSCKENAPKND